MTNYLKRINIINITIIFTIFIVVFYSIEFLYKGKKNRDSNLNIINGNTMGTYYVIKYHPKNIDQLNGNKVKDLIALSLQKINNQMSTYLEKSEITKFNHNKILTENIISHEFYYVLKFSLDLAQKTSGYFDPTIGPLVNIWGFGPKKKQHRPSYKEINKVLKYVGYNKISLTKNGIIKKHQDVYLDLSSVAKGFAVDYLSGELNKIGINNHLVEIGGEIKAQGYKNKKSWVVGIESPINGRKVLKTVNLNNKSIATSGSYRNFININGSKVSHIVNPKTGQAFISNLISVSIIAKSCMEADALATALISMGEKLAISFVKKNKLSAMFIIKTDKGYRTFMTEGFNKLISANRKGA